MNQTSIRTSAAAPMFWSDDLFERPGLYTLPVVFLAAHALAILLLPEQAGTASLLFLIAAPLVAAFACRLCASRGAFTLGWMGASIAMGLWSAGMAATLFGALAVEGSGGVDGVSVLLYVIYGVPLIFVMASVPHELWYVRLVDGALALALGILFFVHTFSFATMTGATAAGVLSLRTMLDIENVFIASFALIRFWTSADTASRSFFGTLSAFTVSYLFVASYINHFQADTDYGTLVDLLIGMPFLLLTILALRHDQPAGIAPRRSLKAAHIVRAGSPLMLAASLLAISCLLVAERPAISVGGFLVAALGMGLRNILVQTRSFEDNDRLHALARVDALTGLANRRQFDDILRLEWRRAVREGGSLALLMIDVDRFKILNDTFGHPVGDESLREVGKALASCATRGGDLVARYGGEEFAVILPNTAPPEAHALADAMRLAVSGLQLPSPASGGVVTISIGVGHAGRPEGADPASLLRVADAALYAAKSGGRNRIAGEAC